ncbi:MAG: hypothetical protein KDI74_15185 [Gammaproteobacteria bacterium]|nr:hypothetical protein [Gammaproteobacteria bacterium]HXK56862.1 hypothetical protein [Gammaproteobacteria bacterium]
MSLHENDERVGKLEVRLLCAYIDRELDEQSRQEVDEVLRLDPEALRYVIQAKKLNALTRMALDAGLNLPEGRNAQKALDDKLKHYQEELSAGKVRTLNGIINHPYFALAASIILLVIGFQAGTLSLDYKIEKKMLVMETEKRVALAAVESERNRVLEYLPSGQTTIWKSDNGYIQAELMPIRTLRTENNQYCREYKEVVVQNEKSESRHAVSCRQGKEVWRTKLILLSGDSQPM